MKCGLNTSNKVVCDFSMALLGTISMAFCKNSNIKLYIEKCFGVLIGFHQNLPNKYIRIDIAYVMKTFCRNKNFQGKNN